MTGLGDGQLPLQLPALPLRILESAQDAMTRGKPIGEKRQTGASDVVRFAHHILPDRNRPIQKFALRNDARLLRDFARESFFLMFFL